ncbi:cytochrome c oxidase assembly factor 4 homolog, mitochondrial-like [Portunus trituberculatus]|uniref:Cytochrome c oxidase assembly factor 4, mitochondrial n=1 Tax=Portunus trituberculatus TaxID=210409 RepID=A0A5B7HBG8_PORTR|nr:cytochrome c oxidase assembly factor 4 homolog, mitochondrial-like [Portunus trituberculatus]MPC66084.1 Cytochrome c oxidase assembly factor 4, mitochondrial [Portunus trituberculatus]
MSADPHRRTRVVRDEDEDEEEDPVEAMIAKTGCLEKHYAIQFCMADHKDWRKCQDQVKDFQHCITEHNKKKYQ